MSDMTTTGGAARRMPKFLRNVDPAVESSFSWIIALLVFLIVY